MRSKRAMLSLSVVLLFWAPFVSAQVNFNLIPISSGALASTGVATGDFNNDGILDFITVNEDTPGSISFYKGLGGGNYASPVNTPISQPSAGQAMAADFKRDGKLDLAIVPDRGAGGGVLILLGNGDGSFRQETTLNVPGDELFLTLADFNGDHQPDIAVSYGGSTSGTKVYVGQGDGTFKLSADLPLGGWQLVSGDFNADGHQDIALCANGVSLYLGKGDGTFQSPISANVSNPSWLAVGDFYNNRVQSLALLTGEFLGGGNFETELYTLRYSNGQLLVENHRVVQPVTAIPFQLIAAGDLDGDFKDDLFLVGGDFQGSALSNYMIGNGDGTFQDPVDAPRDGDLQDQVLIRDVNGDSRHDAGVAFTSIFDSFGGLEVLLNTGAKTNCTPPPANALDVHICSPMNAQLGKTFTFSAAGNAFNGAVKRMELWIDGKKMAQNLSDQLNVTLTLNKGLHVASVVAVDTFDNYTSRSVKLAAIY